jgi:deoxyribodipyrimidine photo-lyase
VKTAIWWARRDLRLADNQVLSAALAQAEQVVPLFVVDLALSWIRQAR